MDLFKLFVSVGIDTVEFVKGITSAKKDAKEFVDEVKKTGTAIGGLASETKEVGHSMDHVGKKAGRFGDILKANLTSDLLVGSVKRIGGAVTDLGRILIDFASDGVILQSDLEEVQNVVDTTFGSNRGAVDQFAKSAANSFGLSEKYAKQYSGTMGAMLKSMGLTDEAVLRMSTDVTGLSGDMASFYNLDSGDAFEKIRSGISGETEPLKQLGINMSVANLEAFALSEGMDASYKSMSQAEQATLRYQYLMKVTADAQGDFAKTLPNSFANQARVLEMNIENVKMALGKKLLPAVVEVTGSLNDLLAGNIGLDVFVKNMAMLVSTELPGLLSAAGGIVRTLGSEILKNLPQMTEVGLDVLSSLLNGFVDGLPTISPILAGVVTMIVRAILENGDELIYGAVSLIGILCNGIVTALPTLAQNAPAIVWALISGIFSVAWQLVNVGLELIVQLLAGIGQCFAKLRQIGQDMMGQIFKGLKDIWGGIVTWFNSVWNSLFGHRSVNITANETVSKGVRAGRAYDGSHAGGLSYVPFDGYLAKLHQGEMVLPSVVAAFMRSPVTAPDTTQPTGGMNGSSVTTVNAILDGEAILTFVIDWLRREVRT